MKKEIVGPDSLRDLREMKKSYTEKMKEEGQGMIQSIFTLFFLNNPNVVGVKWRQYTPYWNDGEPCTFRCGSMYFLAKDAPEESGDYGDGYEDVWGLGQNSPSIKAPCEEFEEQFAGSDDVLLVVFGDHSEIVATRDGFEVESYEHF